jgi:serine/threonine-protein kinase
VRHARAFRLQKLLDRGGMSEVHRAFDTRRGRIVALKILVPRAGVR